MTVVVRVDPARCRGHQMCVLGSPDVFVESSDDDGTVEVAEPHQPDTRLEALRLSQASCPEGAISVAVGDE